MRARVIYEVSSQQSFSPLTGFNMTDKAQL